MSIANVPFTLDAARRYGVSPRRMRAGDLWIPSRTIRIPKNAIFSLFDSCRALTAATPHAVISHLTAARLYGFYLPWRLSEQGDFDLAKPAGQARPRRKNVHGRELQLNPCDVGELAGIPITSEQRTLLDISPLLSVDELVAIADQLVCEHHRSFGRQEYPTVPLQTLRAYIAQNRNHRGVRKLDEAMKLVEVGSDSPKETELRLLIGRWHLPVFSHNVEIRDAAGNGKVGPDLANEEYRTCAEYDGDHHFSRAQQTKDHDRNYITASLGWHQILINNEDFKAGERVLITKIARALKLGGWADPQNLAGRSLKGFLNSRKDYD